MTDDEPTALPEDVASLLVAERGRPGVDAATRTRLRTRVRASVGAGASATPPSVSRPPGSASLFRRLRSLHPALTGVVGLAVGLAAGAAIQSRLDGARTGSTETVPDPAPRVPAQPSTSPVVDAPTAAVPPSEPPPEGRPTSSGGERSPESVAPPAASVPTLSAERALLDVAHAAFANGQAAEALDALGRHATRFPRGVYREEREALTVQSLRALGRTTEADRKAIAFEARYPTSLFLGTLKPSASSNP